MVGFLLLESDTYTNKFFYRLTGQIDYLESQFALVGDKKSNEKSVLMMDGPADYLLYTSGRRHVQFGHWWLKVTNIYASIYSIQT
jgi:hypothetical protein